MKRRLFAILSALSLLLFVAVVVLWVRSYGSGSLLGRYAIQADEHRWHEVQRGVFSACGGIAIGDVAYDHPRHFYGKSRVPIEQDDFWVFGTYDPDPGYPFLFLHKRARWWESLGFNWVDESQWGTRRRAVVAPYWFLVVVTALLPSWTCLEFLHRKRLATAGRCLRCGYDLRATPERCPECGTVTASCDQRSSFPA